MILRFTVNILLRFHQIIDNNNFFKLSNVWLIFNTPFFANFSHVQKYAAEFELKHLGEFLINIQL